MSKKKIFIIMSIIIFIIVDRLYYNFNLILINHANRNELADMLKLEYHNSFKPINIKHNSYDVECYELKYLISKDEYSMNRLKYSKENFVTATVDFEYFTSANDDSYLCIIGRSNLNDSDDLDILREIAKHVSSLKSMFILIYVIVNILLYDICFKERQLFHSKKIIVYLVLFTLLIVIYKYGVKEKKEDNHQNIIKKEIVEKSEDIYYSDNINMRMMLADILNYEDNILITEDNIDYTLDIIKKTGLKNGIYIEKSSVQNFQKVLDCYFGEKVYIIDDNYYIKKQSNNSTNNHINIDNIINREKKIYVIHFDNTYKSMLEDGSILDFMIEENVSSQVFKYNDYINVILINPNILNISDEKQFYETSEEILVNIFDK